MLVSPPGIELVTFYLWGGRDGDDLQGWQQQVFKQLSHTFCSLLNYYPV